MAGSVEDMKAQSDSVSSAGLSSAGLSSTGLSSTGAPFDACAVREFVLVAHCLLNPCAKCAGLRNSEAAAQCVRDFFDRGIGIIQLPCIEMDMLGVSRWGHVKDQFEYPHYRKRCRELLSPVVDQVADYVAHGFSCVGVVGIDGSPTCGVRFCFRGAWGGEFLRVFARNALCAAY